MIKIKLTLLFSILSVCNARATVDFVIFSYDRPLQLYALLESTERYVTGLDRISIIYRVSSPEYQMAYQEVQQRFPAVNFVCQSPNPESDFKALTIQTVFESDNPYIIFGVDDMVITDLIDLQFCVAALEQTNAYAFYLRLGKNICHEYQTNRAVAVPKLARVAATIYAWPFASLVWNAWYYPHTVDMTLYRKADIAADLKTMTYKSPNSLEGEWALRGSRALKKFGLCFEHSKVVNIPLNRVQTTHVNNKITGWATPAQLLEYFNAGLKIDTASLHKFDNKSVHCDFEPILIER